MIDLGRHEMLLRTDDADVTVDMASVKRLDVSRGRTSRAWHILKNGAAGLLVGSAGGALIGPLLWSKDCYTSKVEPLQFGGCVQDLSDGDARLKAATYFGVAGALIGGLFGTLVKTGDRWEEIPLHGLQVNIAPRRDAWLSLAMTASF
jgi:hypothetical protein